ncbi:MAG: sterol desaturase family protein [Aquisalimonadaceae bacterium]
MRGCRGRAYSVRAGPRTSCTSPAAATFWWQADVLRSGVGAQAQWLQFLEIVLLADLTQYWVHRGFHTQRRLWPFHAVHHSSRAMDWLAGSRLHLVDIVITRALVLLPVVLLGFSMQAVYAYLVFVAAHAVFVHANVRFRFGWLENLLVTPRFHHWHHSAAAEAVNRNFAVHFPWLDRLFGTHYLPAGDRWPDDYGVAGDPVPIGYLAQLLYPVKRQNRGG